MPSAYREGLVSHNDPNLDNIIFRDGEAVALIDFDLASPGSALWDVAVAARLWVPLRDPVNIPDDRARRAGDRLRLFADAYELDPVDRSRLADAATQTHGWCYDLVRAGADMGQLRVHPLGRHQPSRNTTNEAGNGSPATSKHSVRR